MKTMKRLAAFTLVLCMLVTVLLPQLSIEAEAATAQSASFISRTDGVWLWPTTYYAVSDWAGCNASPTSNSYCHFCGVQHGLCGANHLTTLGHNGVDIPVGIGSEVYATASGTLYCTNTDWAYRGKTAVVEHPITGTGWSYYSIYQHLNSTATAKNGRTVSVGEVIAWSGNTDGFGTGQAHLHFGLLMAASGQGSALAQNPNANISAIENQGWITKSGYATGRILVNPALNSPAGDPTYTDGCRNNVRTHAGSVMYTRNKSEVSIGSDSVPVAAYDGLIAVENGIYVHGWAFDPDTVNEYVGIQVYLNGEYWKTIVANTSRPDVHAAHGCGENHGFAFDIPITEAGTYSVHLYAVNTTAGAANRDMGAKEITIIHTHTYLTDCDDDCNVCGAVREAPHHYLSDCDTYCLACGMVRTSSIKHIFAGTGSCLQCGAIFVDVSLKSWQAKPVIYAYEKSLMVGKGTDDIGNIIFEPDCPISREEFVQVLYNVAGKPSVSISNKFPDVANNGWYKNAVLWANSKNIANGMGNGKFGVGKSIIRQDLALMLYKYAALKGLDLTAPNGKIDRYADGAKVSGYAKTAMNWAVTNGVLSGKGTANADFSAICLDPTGTATRAECAAMLKNFMTAFGL